VSVPTQTSKRQLTTAAPKRQLAASFPVDKPHALTSEAQCQFCLSESEFVQFFQGIYDGQAYMDKSLPKLYVQECIHQTDELKNLFTG